MGLMGLNKGKRAEREIVGLLQPVVNAVYAAAGITPPLLQRNTLQSDRGGYDIVGLDWFAPEVKRCETLSLRTWWEQCKGQAKPSQARPGQARPSQARPSQARPGQAKPSQARPSQAKPSMPSQAKPKYQHHYGLCGPPHFRILLRQWQGGRLLRPLRGRGRRETSHVAGPHNDPNPASRTPPPK
jgi:hypothetical protein